MDKTQPTFVYPLSAMQQGMLFHSLYAPASGVNIQQIIGTLRHQLDASVFRCAWQNTVQNHEVFRTAFRPDGMQEVYAQVEVPFEEHDWHNLTRAEGDARLTAYLKTDRRRAFVTRRAPLLRIALFRWGEREHRFVWTFHHALLDGQSFAPLLREVFARYHSILSGKEIQFPPVQPFREYINWLQQQNFPAAESFWRELLCQVQAPTVLNFGHPSTRDVAETEYGDHTVHVPESTTARLRQFAASHGLSLNTLLQAAWALLLCRYTGEETVLFGVTRSCRRSSLPGADSMIGLFINTIPVPVRVDLGARVLSWLKQLRELQSRLREHGHTPLADIQTWSGVPAGQSLFESILVFSRATLQAELQAAGGEWDHRDFRVIDQTNYPLTLLAFDGPEMILKFEFDQHRFDAPVIARLAGHLQVLLEGLAANPEARLAALPMLTETERRQTLVEWNQTRVKLTRDVCIHELFETQVRRTPDACALAFEEATLSYRQLDQRAQRLAHHLRKLGAGPESLIGLCIERSLDMVVGLLGILKAGAAYVPLDPDYPSERLAHMIEDSKISVLVTQTSLRARVPAHPQVVCLDALDSPLNPRRGETGVRSSNLAYVIYTSGSTGKSKGVMLTHRNVVSFFLAMDRLLGGAPPGVWLAVTSISFDISALELLWTLTHGFKVVIHAGEEHHVAPAFTHPQAAHRKLDFSLFYFSGDEGRDPQDKYRLLLEGAKFADEAGLAAVWTPERHFHAFGGLYPNPSVTSAAIAAVTRRVRIRAGSVVLPLHDPIRVAEEWAVVDNLSHGRVDMSFASGWHSNDFVFAPGNYAERKQVMLRQIATFQKLWRGEPVSCRGGDGRDVQITILPRPVQRDVPIWLTASSSPETFRLAGEMGANVLTNLLGQTVEDLGKKLEIYRRAWREHGHGPRQGHVTLMLHTYLGSDLAAVREKVRKPFTEYLKTSVDLIHKAASAWSFAAFKKPSQPVSATADNEVAFQNLDADDLQAMLDHAFERYFETSSLFGTPQSCRRITNDLKAVGVDEIACLIDFGVDTESVLSSLAFLKELNVETNAHATPSTGSHSLAQLMRRHGVTHFQCTPSLARMLVSDPAAAEALGSLREFLVGGEALPRSLADQLLALTGGRLRNMYGPTETAVWSTTELVARGDATVPIGRPLANTEIYILDRHGQPAPVGLPGELHIGGKGVARGYLNRPELTAEKFIPHPFRSESGARLYRTGDLARYRADGSIEFLGRLDHQVKLRGHRIELGEIETALAAHPLVKEAVVAAVEDRDSGAQRLVAYIVPRPNNQSSGTAAPNVNTAQWQMIWDETYESIEPTSDPVFNLAGWTSSYTGKPMPGDEMKEWVDGTVERILSLQPRHVLEIGCGTGLLLLRLAPCCASYCGVDFSKRALDHLRCQLSHHDLSDVTLRQGTAVDFDGLDAEFHDTVILNSVVQYFPDLEYLLAVLEKLVQGVEPGGRIFIGDVRSLPLLEAFHASVEINQCPPNLTRAQFRRRVADRVDREEELIIDPAFFQALTQRFPQISHAEIRLKPGRLHNELTRFRYDAILHIGEPPPRDHEISWIDWPAQRTTIADLRKLLAAAGRGALVLTRIPNSRLRDEHQLIRWLNANDGPETVGEFRARTFGTEEDGLDPHELQILARETGHDVQISSSEADPVGTCTAVFCWPGQLVRLRLPGASAAARPLTAFANRPATVKPDKKIAARLRLHLRRTLPEIMVPSAFVVLDALPLTPNGKVDRSKLPAPDAARPELKAAFVAPATPVEHALASIWCALLGLDQVGTADSFFELGGHSLLATQLVSQLREVFQVELPLRVLFDAPTLAQLSANLVDRETQPGLVVRTANIFNQLERMSPEEVEQALNAQGPQASA